MAQGRRFATTLVLIRTFRRIASNATTKYNHNHDDSNHFNDKYKHNHFDDNYHFDDNDHKDNYHSRSRTHLFPTQPTETT
jgi:hypothetical protein